MFTLLAFWKQRRRAALVEGSGPPAFTAIAISFPIRENCLAIRSQRANMVDLRTSKILPIYLFMIYSSLFLVSCSLFLVPCSLFLVPCSLFLVPCSLFLVPCSLPLLPSSVYCANEVNPVLDPFSRHPISSTNKAHLACRRTG